VILVVIYTSYGLACIPYVLQSLLAHCMSKRAVNPTIWSEILELVVSHDKLKGSHHYATLGTVTDASRVSNNSTVIITTHCVPIAL
jgi:hypothetical protein